MSRDDEDRFRPRPGRIRSDARGGAATKSFFTRVRKIARQHGAGPPGASAYRKSGGSGSRARAEVGVRRGVRRGRGAAFVRGRTLGERGWSHRQPGARRVMVKSRSVRAAGKNGRAAAHLRYIQRDGTSRDGERGRLYSATQDRTDGDAFLDRGKDDRHQFRVIVSPPQGARLIGQYDSQIAFGQSRVLLVWTRLLMPNGRSIVLERQPGTDAAGYSGLEDEVDNHWGVLFKAAVLSTLLSVGSVAGTSGNENNLVQAIRRGGSQSFNQVGQRVVSRNLDIQPTLTIRPGFPVRVIVNRDLMLAPYHQESAQ